MPKDPKTQQPMSDWTSTRTYEGYLNDLQKVKSTGEMVNGIKGPCILNRLKHFNPVTNTCIDFMHSLLEGVCKKFFEYWFDSEHHEHPSNMRKYMQVLEKRLLNIRPPKFVPSTPRSIYSHGLWRAHE